ncbi:thiamine biosynthesis/tRNA modification protein ThiI [Methanococcus vannielii SB]|uniref:Probable tRNA sulfurtransferase n=1 Tax=Methanococcus vannielii (strain ATCC 35089 / DSM 1224 / JCM 13029 / OCM 148 / SB) TaxID=406327 RepID=A6UPZ8_METVS|nr:thiamine biosynthesis/tRNA modification protein ThiI [Methanococcus vannielii SB]
MRFLKKFIVRYGEIGTKSRTTMHRFEKLLASGIFKLAKKHGIRADVEIIHTRLIVDVADENFEKMKELLKKVPGIVSFSPCTLVEPKIEKIKEVSLELFEGELSKYENKDKVSFRVKTQRPQKKFPLTSLEVNMAVGGPIVEKHGIKVDLTNPTISIDVEILNEYSFVFVERIDGIGGIPVGTQGKVLVLLSDGIDSPVAAYMMAKRGCKLVLLHLKTSEEGLEKTKKLYDVLSDFDPEAKFIHIDFTEELLRIKNDLTKIEREKYTCLFCKKTMLRTAERHASYQKCDAIINGDNMGQVASQTLKNLRVVSEGTKYPILRPLIGLDKVEIMNIARKIGTFDISISKEISCFAVPKFPITNTTIEEMEKIEERLKTLHECNCCKN